MRKILMLGAAALVAACTTINPADYSTPEAYQAAVAEQQAQREMRRETSVIIAYELIDDFNADGIDPIQMRRSSLSALKAGCLLLQVYSDKVAEIVNRRKSPEEAIPIKDVRLTIAAACDVIMKAAAKARLPEA